MNFSTYRIHPISVPAYPMGRLDPAPLWRAERQCTDCEPFQQMQQQLINVERGRDQWLATVAHELRNPLGPLQNGIEMLMLPDHTQERLAKLGAMMERQFKHLRRLIDDLEDVSRIRYGKLTLRLAPVELRAVAAMAVESLGDAATHRRIEIHADADLDLTVNGDLDRLMQVFYNLLSNACAFTVQGGRISVNLQRCGDHVVASVRDDGQGMTMDVLRGVFDMFKQGPSDKPRQHGGLGIGLALVKQLVELHGGDVSANSEGPGKGAEFTVSLPATAG